MNDPAVLERMRREVASGFALHAKSQRASAGARPGSRALGEAGGLRVLCVHGIGHHDQDLTWQGQWAGAIRTGVTSWDQRLSVAADFLMYDKLFEKAKLNLFTYAGATASLAFSAVVHGVGDLFRDRAPRGDLNARLRWTMGMVAQWAKYSDLRSKSRNMLGSLVKSFDPHVVCAHSMGSLVSYDTFVRDPSLIAGRWFVSLGSQIGNPAVRSTLGGTILPLKTARHWYHLFNRHDDVLTTPLRIFSDNFTQVDTPFNIEGIADHDAAEYLGHEQARVTLWRDVAASLSAPRAAGIRAFSAPSPRRAARDPRRRALIVGINEYPDPASRLEGCVNDAFLMSQTLQEAGFPASGIRLLLNDRATAAEITTRLDWLVDGAREGDHLVFAYSGHGAQMAGYNALKEIDHVDECLVPYDFDWTPEHAILDDQFFEFYSQLPYGVSFVSHLDCCHSGGLARGGVRVRGLTPPDDIRHRLLAWRDDEWAPRRLPAAPGQTRSKGRYDELYAGEDGNLYRFGRALALRAPVANLDASPPNARRKPFMPTLLEACQENELAQEYRSGSTSYGAFTFLFARELRKSLGKRPAQRPSFQQLIARVKKALVNEGYTQAPALVIPNALRNQPIPW